MRAAEFGSASPGNISICPGNCCGPKQDLHRSKIPAENISRSSFDGKYSVCLSPFEVMSCLYIALKSNSTHCLCNEYAELLFLHIFYKIVPKL